MTSSIVPLGFGGYSHQELHVDGYVPVPEETMSVLVNRVSDDYFTTLEIALVRGRPIQPLDAAGALPVAVVNEAFAQQYWGLGDPLGKRIRLNDTELTVIGVVQNGKYHYRDLDNASPPFIYTALQQGRAHSVILHVRSNGDPYALVQSVRNVLNVVDPKLLLLNPTTLDAHTSVGLFPVRLGTTVLGSVSILAVLLAAMGLYAVFAPSVRQRRREIGIRMALGAAKRRIVMTITRDSWRHAAIGIGVGMLLAAGTARVMARVLPRIDAGDVAPFAVALTLLLAVAAISTLIPAWRAAASEPAIALKAE